MKSFLKIFVALVFLGFLAPTFALAQSLSLPHQFFGSVNFTNGVATDGLVVEAKIDGVVVGNSVTNGGNYGYNPNLLFALDNQGVYDGETVEFYVSGIKANETAVFANGQSTNLPLTVTGSVGIIEETDENAVIENETVVVAPDQNTNIRLGENLNIIISSTVSTNAEITKIEKLESDFFTGVTAIIAGDNLLNAFEIDITGDDLIISVTITYDDTGIDEDTIKPYRFDGSSWVALDFTINKSANTITFTVSSAETPYAVFGSSEPEPEPTPSPSGGGGGGGGGGGSIIASTSTASQGDATGDGIVDVFDFNTLMVNWGNTSVNNTADFNGDGKVDVFDFNLLMVNWTL